MSKRTKVIDNDKSSEPPEQRDHPTLRFTKRGKAHTGTSEKIGARRGFF
jgi:hypothetical protein